MVVFHKLRIIAQPGLQECTNTKSVPVIGHAWSEAVWITWEQLFRLSCWSL